MLQESLHYVCRPSLPSVVLYTSQNQLQIKTNQCDSDLMEHPHPDTNKKVSALSSKHWGHSYLTGEG